LYKVLEDILKELGNKTGNYFKDVKEEMNKVVWPSKSEVYQSTIIVLMLSLFVAVFLGFADMVFDYLLKLVF